MDQPEKRLRAAREIFTRAVRELDLGFGLRLWDGGEIPPARGDSPLRVTIADEGALASLLRRPSLDTFIRLHVAGRVDWTGGTIFDLAALRPAGKPGRAARRIGLLRLLRAWWSLARAPREATMEAGRGDAAGTRRGDAATNARNIAHHYDVSNAFYRLFLDPEMVYTCAYFSPDFHDDLARAQRDKLDMICRKLRLRPGQRHLDIGCGWGALVCHAAEHHGVRAVGITLSQEQAAIARERVAARGLSDRVEIRLVDYNEMKDEPFDTISSVGMFEHVGIDNHRAYFAAVHRLLKPGGLYLHHAISRPAKGTDRQFRRMRAEYRALVRYIFPGGELDHVGMSIANLERAKFEIHDVEGWRMHYARTTRLWHDNLLARRAEAEAEVGPEKTRMWLLYLGGCSLAFERGAVGIFQTLASRRNKGALPTPATRADLYR
ncbi:class I SAM-dependent methyltransferase [Alsobacter sp. SYSU M60028]|uniref:Class I SAM-dependent methyltransferase n=1 Tax=Alsobacter ponti TaxID=2962936 RepID=A0ABT1LFB3_9HYPH|nr:class I SAM-dependent methyltransferase [Alsobacter ponti]MCP8940184.1 class I SAM-dependent methyltransferase [Alsobacter ponti]